VVLSVEKFAAAGIEVQSASRHELQSHRIVPGRIDYNATRHVLVKSPFDGLIRRIDVKVGDQVTEGQVMGIVDSPELGERRSDVLLRETDLEQAKNEHDWWHSIQSNLDELLARLKRAQEMGELEKEFADKPLGDYRQQILGAYSRMRLDEALAANVKPAVETGGVSRRAKMELDAARDTAIAKFNSVCEQAKFDVKQMHIKTEAAMKDAQRRLAVAKQRLGLLVNQSQEALTPVASDEALSAWPVKAPFQATVEEVLLAPKERIQLSEGLIQLADTTKLWVQADIRERDWSALSISSGQTVSVQTPALPGQTLQATVSFIGRTVTLESRAVPLIADIDNSQGLLRPGMFVRVLIPDGTTRECLAVPQSAISMNDGRTFVFVETGPREFHPRNVKTGVSVDPWVEIKTGVEVGDRVVTSGTAILKAELLLEAEE
jgi:cobalt-zinc-cadmium efflux system membrane fusion protein